MKKRIFSLLVLLLISVCVFAQSPDWQWVTTTGGIDSDASFGIATDNLGNTYTTGFFRETAIFGANSLTSDGQNDIFLAKFDASGECQWAINAGGVNDDRGSNIIIDNSCNTYIIGEFKDTATFGSFTLISKGYVHNKSERLRLRIRNKKFRNLTRIC